MKFATHQPVDDAQWHNYKQLELISESVPNPSTHRNPIRTGLNIAWRSLLALLVDELIEEQQVEYLERCWSLNELGERERSSSSLHRLWALME